MSGMVTKGYDRLFFFKNAYVQGHETISETNEAADGIIESPDRYLLSQKDLFVAEGGWGTFALTVGLGVAGAACLVAVRPQIGTYLAGGQLRAKEWALLGGATFVGGLAGQQIGIHSFGNKRAYHNHWMAYTYVKSMNRYDGKNVLSKAPFMY